MEDSQVVAPNPMLGSQLVCKSIVSPAKVAPISQQQLQSNNKSGAHQQVVREHKDNNNKLNQNKCHTGHQQHQTPSSLNNNPTAANDTSKQSLANDNNNATNNNNNNHNNNNDINNVNANCQKDGVNSTKLKSVLCQAQEARLQQVEHHALEAGCNGQHAHQQQAAANGGGLSARDSELLAKEAQDLKIKTRKLQLEIEEKNEIINVLKDELETLREQSDKFQRENIQLIKDAKRVKFLQDENDFLQDKVGSVEKLELEITRLKAKLNELDFLKLRIHELEEDRNKAQEESAQFEDKWNQAESRLTRVAELESELNKWKLFSHELEQERNSIQSKLLESIEQESKLNSINKKVEDEVKRLRDLIKSYEEQRDEEQASNSLIMSVADLKRIDQVQQQASSAVTQKVDLHEKEQQTDISQTVERSVGTDIRLEIDQLRANEFDKEENRNLKERLEKQGDRLKELFETNKEIRAELEGNRKLISDLRQDLACEKSLAQKLTSQLTSFTKQIKSLDKQYFPIHDTTITNSTIEATSLKINDKFNEFGSLNNKRHEGNDSSPLKSSMTTTIENSRHQHAQRHRSNENERDVSFSAHSLTSTKRAIELQGSNKNSNNKNDEEKSSDNETKQQVYLKNHTKLSASTKESATATTTTTTTYSKLNKNENYSRGKQSITDNRKGLPAENDEKTAKNFLEIAIEQPTGEVRTVNSTASSSTSFASACSSIVTNKSAATVTLEGPEADKDIDESCRGTLWSPAVTSYSIGNGHALSADGPAESRRQQQSTNSSFYKLESARKTLFSPMIDSSEDSLKAKRKHAHNNIGNNSIKVNGNAHTTSGSVSISPSSSARSQSSSPPSVAVTIGHDSGFQSINHDFNQISPTNTGAETARKLSTFRASSSSNGLSNANVEFINNNNNREQQQIASAQSNRSTPLTGMRTTTLETVDRENCSTPTQFRDKVPRSDGSGAATSQDVGATNPVSDDASQPTVPVDESDHHKQKRIGQRRQQLSAAANPTTTIANSPKTPPLNDSLALNNINRCTINNDYDSPTSNNGQRTKSSLRDTNLLATVAHSSANIKCVDEVENDDLSENCNSDGGMKGSSTAAKSRPQTTNNGSNFVRNSLPSRSVNFGHSKSSAYLDRIRASVTASTTTNTISSFNEQTMGSVVLSSSSSSSAAHPQQSINRGNQSRPGTMVPPRFVLNCMLDHQHSERCFVSADAVAPAHVQVSQVNPSDAHHHHSNHHHHHANTLPIRSSRQLNALIDPVASEQLMLGMLQRQAARLAGGAPSLQQPLAETAQQQPYAHHLDGNVKLTEQQIAQLNNLHRQHYYHHLHQLHQMHHHVHLHHLHHKQQQQQQQQQQACSQQEAAGVQQQHQNANANQHHHTHCDLTPTGGRSQFYAPGGQYDLVYANMAANNRVNMLHEQNSHQQGTKLVNNNHNQQQPMATVPQPPQPSSNGLKQDLRNNSPRKNPGAYAQVNHLPQINEMNGLPTVEQAISVSQQQQSRNSPNKQRENQLTTSNSNNTTPKTTATRHKQPPISNGLPASASSSPTSSSSASSNLSPSSTTSSSSSLNSLSASSAPLNRSSLRHTTTDLNKCQFSVERELVGSMPMTATLSRVGSCRGVPARTNGCNSNHMISSLKDGSQMRNPVKLQQPPMRTSKILSISQQSATTGQLSSIARQQLSGDGINVLPCDLADIKLNDNLAFSSLRAPKKSSSGSNLNQSLNIGQSLYGQTGSGAKISSYSSSPDKRRQAGNNSRSKANENDNSGNSNNNNNSGKSSVWFEYGCV